MKITPNLLTLSRVVLAFLTFYFVFQISFLDRILALILFTIAALTDLWDGWLARKKGMITDFGKIMDPIADKLLILGNMICLSALGMYPFWALVPIVFREVLITGVRLYLLTKNVVVAAEKGGKIKVVSQIVSLFITFVWLVIRDYAHKAFAGWPVQADAVSLYANYFFLAVATWFTLISGWEFFKHNWRSIYA